MSGPLEVHISPQVRDGLVEDGTLLIELYVNEKRVLMERPALETVARTLQRLQKALRKKGRGRGRSPSPGPEASARGRAGGAAAEEAPVLLCGGDVVGEAEANRTAWRRATELRVPDGRGGFQPYAVRYRPPKIVQIDVPAVYRQPLVNCPIVTMFVAADCDGVHLDWFVRPTVRGSANAAPWAHAAEGPSFSPPRHLVDHDIYVRATPRRGRESGRPASHFFTRAIRDAPAPRLLELRRPYLEDARSRPGGSLRFVSYNILADCYSSTPSNKRSYCYAEVSGCLDSNYRFPLALQELNGYDAHVIGLQEVDTSLFHSSIAPWALAHGYTASHVAKAGDAREGCAMLLSSALEEEDRTFSCDITHRQLFAGEAGDGIIESVFPLPEARRKVLSELEELFSRYPRVARDLRERVNSVTQFKVVPLAEGAPGEPTDLIIGNTHLFYHPEADHIRFIQCYGVLECAHAIQRRIDQLEGRRSAIVLLGDFNSTRDTAAYDVLTGSARRAVPAAHPVWRYLNIFHWGRKTRTGHEEDDGGEGEGGGGGGGAHEGADAPPPDVTPSLRSPLEDGLEDSHGDAVEYTNFTPNFKGCLDYILVQRDRLAVAGVAPVPSAAELAENEGLPAPAFPSDHISLVADVALRGGR